MLSQGKKAFGSASYFYLAILVAAGINILSSVYLSSRLEASMAKAAIRHPKSAKFDRSGIQIRVRHFDVPRRIAGNFDKAGVGGADLARLAASGGGAGQGSESNDTADDTATYWELHVVNGRRDQLYVDLLIDSTDGRPRDPGTKDQLPELAQRKVTLDGKTHVIVTTYHRRRQLKPHSTTVVLCFWAEQGAQDNFEFHAEFSLGVDPFEPTDPQYSTNVSQAVRSAFIEFLGREPDPPGLASYSKLLDEQNLTVQQVRDSISSSPEATTYRVRLNRGDLEYAKHPLPPEPKGQLAHTWPPPGTLLSGVVVAGQQERHYKHLLCAPPSQVAHHTAAHGIQFEIESKNAPLVISAVRTSGLAQYMRGSSAPASHLRLFTATDESPPSPSTHHTRTPSSWRLLGQHFGPVPAAPGAIIIPVQPLYMAPGQKMTFLLHSDHPFGVALSSPDIAQLEHEVDRRSRLAGGFMRQVLSRVRAI